MRMLVILYQILVAVADEEVRKNLENHTIDYIDVPNYVILLR